MATYDSDIFDIVCTIYCVCSSCVIPACGQLEGRDPLAPGIGKLPNGLFDMMRRARVYGLLSLSLSLLCSKSVAQENVKIEDRNHTKRANKVPCSSRYGVCNQLGQAHEHTSPLHLLQK
jgi:hypothetical protein